ncbi:MAG: glycosyltransferase, partial [Pseudonocardia sp.]|nr:glycosyltransferase [Pseudonocardia sp.]
MTRVLLDARVRVGGVGAYAAALEAGLESEPGVVVRVFSRGRPFRPWGRAAAAASAARWAADLVHGLHVEAPPCPQPLVVTVPDLIPLDFPASMPSSLRRAVYRRLLDTTLRRANRLITPSPATATSLVRHGADPQQVAVVPLAISPAFRPCSRELRTAARRRFAGGRPYLATAVTGRAHKNAPALAAAAARLRDVAVISTGRPIPGCGGVEFIGVLDPPTVRAFYAGAEAMLNLSHVEGFGLPAAEALACGTPV